jgi:transmembrane sensor
MSLIVTASKMQQPERVWILMARTLSGEADLREQEELDILLQQSPALLEQYARLKQVWSSRPYTTESAAEKKAANILQLSQVETLLARDPKKKKMSMLRWAVVIVILLSLGYGGFQMFFPGQAETAQQVISQKGSRTRTILPDGSTVWVNAGSAIRYSSNFSGATREVFLQGEAYFEVVHEPGRPFIVHAGDVNIKVLGTVFNVRSYPGDKTIETTLIKGLVQITTSDRRQKPIYLHPNQKIAISQLPEQQSAPALPTTGGTSGDLRAAITNLDSSLKEDQHLETAWVFNRLEFRGDSFPELAEKLERWYNISIHFQDETVKQLTFNGSLQNETVSQAFHALETANFFHYKITGNEVFISSADHVQ